MPGKLGRENADRPPHGGRESRTTGRGHGRGVEATDVCIVVEPLADRLDGRAHLRGIGDAAHSGAPLRSVRRCSHRSRAVRRLHVRVAALVNNSMMSTLTASAG